MPNTMTLISSVTVGSGGASTIGFTSIPSTYTDLKVLFSFRDNTASIWNNLLVTFNGSNTYAAKSLVGTGSGSAVSQSSSSNADRQYTNSNSTTANFFGSGDLYIPNYTSSDTKTFSSDTVGENHAASSVIGMMAGSSSLTSAINAITFAVSGQSFLQYSTAYLYGIKNS